MKHLKILIIDDDETTCTLLETILEMEGYQTASVNDIENEDILSLLNNEKPYILILDFHLGSKETLKHLTTIRNTSEWQSLPVLMTSAIDRKQDCVEAGATGFILKPFDWQEMSNTVNKIRDAKT